MAQFNNRPTTGKVVAFTTKDGSEHLGFFKSLVNPCGDYGNNEDYNTFFFSEDESNSFRESEVRTWRYVSDIKFFYKENENDEYFPLSIDKTEPITRRNQEESKERLNSFFDSISIASKSGISKSSIALAIRRWILLNSECTDDIYIDEKSVIHTHGTITLLNPSYIIIAGKQ